MTLENPQFRLASRPVGMAKASDFQQAAEPLRELADGEITVKTLYLSLDPAMRGWMNDAKSYIRPVAIGEVMRAGGVGEVVASKSPKYAVGDIVSGGIGVQAYWQGAADDKSASFFKVDSRLAPLTTWMNTLGMPGMTAYFGLLEVGKPAKPWWYPVRPAPWARPWARWPSNWAAAWSALPAAKRNATSWSMSWALTPASTTRPVRCATA
jgi:NADPH-dependent curcumin reductase CurA